MTEETQITIFEPVKPLQTANQARQMWEDFEALKKSLLSDSDYQKIGKTAFIKRSGFRKIAVAFGLSDEILDEERTDREDGTFMWRVKVRVTAPNGRVNTGVGICDSRERNFAHLEHDVYATSHTRAKSRAISDMVAGGVVSAEEMQSGSPQTTQKTQTRKVVENQSIETPMIHFGSEPELAKFMYDIGVLDSEYTYSKGEGAEGSYCQLKFLVTVENEWKTHLVKAGFFAHNDTRTWRMKLK